MTCENANTCTKCKGNFTKVAKDGSCECIEGTEKADGDINCKKTTKPNVVVPGTGGEEEEEEEKCIVIKKITKEGSSGWLEFT